MIARETNCLCEAKTSSVDFEDLDILKSVRDLDIRETHWS